MENMLCFIDDGYRRILMILTLSQYSPKKLGNVLLIIAKLASLDV